MRRRPVLYRISGFVLLLSVFGASLRTQETLLAEFARTGWSVSSFLRLTEIDGESGVMLGGRLGLIYNGHITLGGFGGTRVDAGEVYLSQYGGFFEVDFRSTRLVHFSVGALIGGGDAAGDTFFLLEPEGWMLLNLTQRTQFGIGVSYRSVSTYDEPGGEMNGVGIGFIFKVGAFW